MKIKNVILGVAAMAVIGTGILYSCKKDANPYQLTNSIKQQKQWDEGENNHWTEATSFDLRQFNAFPELNMGEFHNNYLDILANSTLFPNQTANNQYDIIYANLTPQLRQQLDEINISAEAIGEIVNNGLQMNGFDDLIAYLQEDYHDIVPYLQQMNVHFNDDMPNNFINGNIDNSLEFFLEMKTDVENSLIGQARDMMLGTIEIAAYSSVYWYNVLWTDAGESPWHPYFIDEDDELPRVTGKFGDWLKKAGKIAVKVCAVVATDVTCFAVGNAVAPGSGVPCAAAGSGVVALALKDW